jgi:hypothetical protein
MIGTILLVAAFILTLLAAFNVGAPWQLGWLGIACWILSIILGGHGIH